jgi:hypothetical protein
MGIMKTLIITLVILLITQAFAQTETQVEALNAFAAQKAVEMQRQKEEAIRWAQANGFAVRSEGPNGSIIEIQKVVDGKPYYYTTDNVDAAISTRTNEINPGGSLGLSLTGLGYDKLGEWDGGAVRGTHQELAGRVTQVDGATTLSDHATHVAGTMIASGEVAAAKGMAYEATLQAYDWNFDVSEMATAAANGLEVSNHSYGYISGWDGNTWYGNTAVSTAEDFAFGFYDTEAQTWDQIAYNAPDYLMVKSAGNDRGDTYTGQHRHFGTNGWFSDTHAADGGVDGYDCISYAGVAKNILTVAAVNDVPDYQTAGDVGMSTFSGWGPTDDGRIKPDISGNGVGLYSSLSTTNTSYASYSGTSMASPNVTGTLALLQQYYQDTHSAAIMRSATLKALVINTADECGSNPGPDYEFGWGLLNAKKAAQTIAQDLTLNVIDEQVLSNGGQFTRAVNATGLEPLKITICWTDPAGTPPAPSLDPTDKMLVNDLNLRVVYNGQTYYPWSLSLNNPAAAATALAANTVDNVEQVYIDAPANAVYTVVVDHSGNIGAGQAFSIVVNGIDLGDSGLPVEMSSYRSIAGDRNVKLEWVTESEIINEAFVVERGLDSTNFKVIAEIDGAGNSSEQNRYSFTDANVFNGIMYYYRLSSRDYNGVLVSHGITSAMPNSAGINPRETEGEVIRDFALHAAYPNPFNPQTAIPFDVPNLNNAQSAITVALYNLRGQKVRTLYDGAINGGSYLLSWDGKDANGQQLPSGTYFVVLENTQLRLVEKVTLVK